MPMENPNKTELIVKPAMLAEKTEVSKPEIIETAKRR